MTPLAKYEAFLARKHEQLQAKQNTPDWVVEEHNRQLQLFKELKQYVQNLERQYNTEQIRSVSLSTACALLEKELKEQIKSDLYQPIKQ